MRPLQGSRRASSTLPEDIVLKLARSAAAMVALTVVVGACSGAASPSPIASVPLPVSASPSVAPAMSSSPSASTSEVMTDTAAADLRVKLDLLLGEHIIFASKATGAALLGHAAEYKAYGAMLNANGTDIGEMIGAAFGPDARDQFNKIWSAHNGYFVDYTVGDQANGNFKQERDYLVEHGQCRRGAWGNKGKAGNVDAGASTWQGMIARARRPLKSMALAPRTPPKPSYSISYKKRSK